MWGQSSLLASEKALRQGNTDTGSGKLTGEYLRDMASDIGGAPRTSVTCSQSIGPRKSQGKACLQGWGSIILT